jgi:hypothetical protein
LREQEYIKYLYKIGIDGFSLVLFGTKVADSKYKRLQNKVDKNVKKAYIYIRGHGWRKVKVFMGN